MVVEEYLHHDPDEHSPLLVVELFDGLVLVGEVEVVDNKEDIGQKLVQDDLQEILIDCYARREGLEIRSELLFDISERVGCELLEEECSDWKSEPR